MVSALVIGTIVFAVLWLIVAFILNFTVVNREIDSKIKSEYRTMAFSLTFLGAFCMWLMWICVYMHQMNPIIDPILEIDEKSL